MVGAKGDKNKNIVRVTFLSDIKKTYSEKSKQKYIKSVPEQPDKKTMKSHEKVTM